MCPRNDRIDPVWNFILQIMTCKLHKFSFKVVARRLQLRILNLNKVVKSHILVVTVGVGVLCSYIQCVFAVCCVLIFSVYLLCVVYLYSVCFAVCCVPIFSVYLLCVVYLYLLCFAVCCVPIFSVFCCVLCTYIQCIFTVCWVLMSYIQCIFALCCVRTFSVFLLCDVHLYSV